MSLYLISHVCEARKFIMAILHWKQVLLRDKFLSIWALNNGHLFDIAVFLFLFFFFLYEIGVYHNELKIKFEFHLGSLLVIFWGLWMMEWWKFPWHFPPYRYTQLNTWRKSFRKTLWKKVKLLKWAIPPFSVMFSLEPVSWNLLIATYQLLSAASLNLGWSQNSVLGKGLKLRFSELLCLPDSRCSLYTVGVSLS